jgi:hypothetical protein
MGSRRLLAAGLGFRSSSVAGLKAATIGTPAFVRSRARKSPGIRRARSVRSVSRSDDDRLFVPGDYADVLGA